MSTFCGESKGGAMFFQQKKQVSQGREIPLKRDIPDRFPPRPQENTVVFSKMNNARVAELVYAHDLKSCSERIAGSIPAPGTETQYLSFCLVIGFGSQGIESRTQHL